MNQEELKHPEKAARAGTPKGFTVGEGLRKNDGKTRYDLIPTSLLKGTADVFEFGMRKYLAWNWCRGMNFSKVIASMKRHLAAIETGEDNDPETHLRHVSHIICNCLMLEHYMNQGWASLDDRPKIYFSDVQPGDHGVDQEELNPTPFVVPDMYKQVKKIDQKLQDHTTKVGHPYPMNEAAASEPNDKPVKFHSYLSFWDDLDDFLGDKSEKQSLADKLAEWDSYLNTFSSLNKDFNGNPSKTK